MPNYKAAVGGTSVRSPSGQVVFLFGGLPVPEYVTGAQLAELVANGRVVDDVEDAPDDGNDAHIEIVNGSPVLVWQS